MPSSTVDTINKTKVRELEEDWELKRKQHTTKPDNENSDLWDTAYDFEIYIADKVKTDEITSFLIQIMGGGTSLSFSYNSVC